MMKRIKIQIVRAQMCALVVVLGIAALCVMAMDALGRKIEAIKAGK